MGISRGSAGLRLAGRPRGVPPGDGVLVRFPALFAGSFFGRPPLPAESCRGPPLPLLPPPGVRGSRLLLSAGGDGPIPVYPSSPLLRRIPSGPGEEGAARTAKEDAESGGDDAGVVLPRDPDEGGVRTGLSVVSLPSPEELLGQSGVHGRPDGGVLPRAGGGVPVRRSSASRVPLREKRRSGVPGPDRVGRGATPLK